MIVADMIVAAHHSVRRWVSNATTGGTSPQSAIVARTWPLGKDGPQLDTGAPSEGRGRPTLDLSTLSDAGRARVATMRTSANGAHTRHARASSTTSPMTTTYQLPSRVTYRKKVSSASTRCAEIQLRTCSSHTRSRAPCDTAAAAAIAPK